MVRTIDGKLMKRAYLKLGDQSGCGGIVVEGLASMFHHGKPLTFLGAQVSCPKCKSTGIITPEVPRLEFDSLTGKRMARVSTARNQFEYQ